MGHGDWELLPAVPQEMRFHGTLSSLVVVTPSPWDFMSSWIEILQWFRRMPPGPCPPSHALLEQEVTHLLENINKELERDTTNCESTISKSLVVESKPEESSSVSSNRRCGFRFDPTGTEGNSGTHPTPSDLGSYVSLEGRLNSQFRSKRFQGGPHLEQTGPLGSFRKSW